MAKGDHIKVKRTGYYHHGIDLGNGEVIHFTGEPGKKRDAAIQRTEIKYFLCSRNLEIVKYSKCFSPDKTISIALKHLGDVGYNLVINNCEHFARYCKTGQKKSEQVNDTVASTGAAVGTGATTTAAIAGVSAAGSAAGLSGAGVMAGLAAIGPGGVIGGLGTLAAAPAIISNLAINKILEDDKNLNKQEREARTAGRTAAKAGTVAAAGGTVATISTAGTAAGLSGAGITSGLAAIGGTVGGGMVAGTAIAVAAPAVAAAAVGYSVYSLWKWISD